MTRPEVVREIVDAARDNGVAVRALGGLAVQLRCPSAQPGGPLWRECGDIDLATTRQSASEVKTVLTTRGYEPAARFNALHGRSRLLFEAQDGHHVDVFVDTFAMCHALDLRPRIRVDAQTLSLADLLLTKLQIAELNRKDVTDAAALLLDHEFTDDDSGINVAYVNGVLCGDWGWWRTVSMNLGHVIRHVDDLELGRAERQRVRGQAEQLLERIDRAPKTTRWRLRARVGERVPWRDEPEETAG